MARYHAEGVRTVLVCCTGGEQGDILNPAMDTPEVRADLAGVRTRELEAAARIIGYDEVVLLGYRDSGMPDTEANADPRSFAQAPLDEAVGRLVRDHPPRPAPGRRHLPGRSGGIPAPGSSAGARDHAPGLRCRRRPGRLPRDGRALGPSQDLLLGVVGRPYRGDAREVPRTGMESPFDDVVVRAPVPEIRPHTTGIDTSGVNDVRRRALLAHATQVDPTSRFWFGLPRGGADQVHPVDDYVLARSRVGPIGAGPEATIAAWEGAEPTPGGGTGGDAVEDDLFAGVRDLAAR